MQKFQPVIYKSHSDSSIYRSNYTISTEKHHQILVIMNCKHNKALKTCSPWLGDQNGLSKKKKKHRRQCKKKKWQWFLQSQIYLQDVEKSKWCFNLRLNKRKYVASSCYSWHHIRGVIHTSVVFKRLTFQVPQ